MTRTRTSCPPSFLPSLTALPKRLLINLRTNSIFISTLNLSFPDFLKPTSMDLQQSISNQTHVSTTLAIHLLSNKSQTSNVVFSPLSIHVVLSLIAAGSKGQTLDQLLDFLKTKTIDDVNSLSSQLVSLILADGSPSGGPRLAFSNGVWVEKTLSLKHSFKQLVDTVYKAASDQVDFQNKAIER